MNRIIVKTKDEWRAAGLTGLETIENGSERAWMYAMAFGSGTTGNPPMITLRHLNLPAREYQLGVASGMRGIPLFTRDAQVRMISPMLGEDYNDETEALILSTSDMDEHLEELLHDYRPERIGGFPTFLESVMSHAPQSVRDIKNMDTGGEMTSEGAHAFLRRSSPHAEITQTYSSAQTGPLGLSCAHLKINQYHPVPGVSIEIESPDENGVGNILVSKPITKFLSLERFPMGDSARSLPRCACGRSDAFEIAGRTDFDFIRIAGAVLHRKEFDRVIAALSSHIADYQVIAEEAREKDRMQGLVTLRIVPTPLCKKSDASGGWLGEELARLTFVTPSQTLADLIRKKLFRPLQIEFVDEIEHKFKKVHLLRK
jgi:phenylacetate-coenzyme A ligase PaaK-like adenylate-forming protein